MAKATSRRLLSLSCKWIAEHDGANNTDVPTELLHQWIYTQEDESVEPSGFYLAVFSFGYLQRQLTSKGVPPGEKRSLPLQLILKLFQVWQLKLALVELHRTTNRRFKPLALFEFPENEEIETWTESTGR